MDEYNTQILKVALKKWEIIPDIIESGIISENKEFNSLWKTYQKTHELPSTPILEKVFNIDLSEDPLDSDVDFVYQKIKDWNQIQFELNLLERLNKFETTTPEDIEELKSKYIKSYDDKVENRFECVTLKDIFAIIDEIENEDSIKISTGYNNIDAILEGGWRPGSTYCVMGLSGLGKSIFLANFARTLWENDKNVLYITTEMNHRQTYYRILRSRFNVTNTDALRSKTQEYVAQRQNISHINVIKVHPNDTTINDIENEVRNLNWKPDTVIIDYFDEIKNITKTANDYEKHGEVAAEMKKLAEVLDVPVITATQTSRKAAGYGGFTKEWVGYESIADSFKKVRTLDNLFSIQQVPDMKDNANHIGTYELNVIKNRYGQSNMKLEFFIDYKTMRIDDDTAEDVKMKMTAIGAKKKNEPETHPDYKNKRSKGQNLKQDSFDGLAKALEPELDEKGNLS
jgi:KaiC/GvpD/RAD55 family RecA-like ATPase